MECHGWRYAHFLILAGTPRGTPPSGSRLTASHMHHAKSTGYRYQDIIQSFTEYTCVYKSYYSYDSHDFRQKHWTYGATQLPPEL